MTWFALTVADGTAGSSLIGQLDKISMIRSNGTPVATVAAAFSGVWCWDYLNDNMYLATVADGTIGGTTWVLQDFAGPSYATTTAAGLITLTTSALVQTGTDNVTAVTPFLLRQNYAYITSLGVNSSIKSITGLTTALSRGQGGSGATTLFGGLVQELPAFATNPGYLLTSTGSAIAVVAPLTGLAQAPTVTFTPLTLGSKNLLQTDNITLYLPAAPPAGSTVEFQVNNVSNVIVTVTDSSLLIGGSFPLTIDTPYTSFTMEYTGSTGWWIKNG